MSRCEDGVLQPSRIVDKDAILVFNVGGTKFETTLYTLQRHPDTKLAQHDAIKDFYRPDVGEYFLDRDADVFKAVLNYYRLGELHAPIGVCGQIFQSELKFWGINESKIEMCCWDTYHSFKERKSILTKMERALRRPSETVDESEQPSKWKEVQRKAWLLFEDPSSSRGAMAFAILSSLIVLLSIITFCMETVPQLKTNMTRADWAAFHGLPEKQLVFADENQNLDNDTLNPTANFKNLAKELSNPPPPTERDLFGINTKQTTVIKPIVTEDHPRNFRKPNWALERITIFCLVWFILELSARVVFAPDKFAFLRRPLTVLEFVSVGGLLVVALEPIYAPSGKYVTNEADVVFGIFHVFRVFPIFRILGKNKGAVVMAYTFRTSINEFGLMSIFIFMSVLLFGTAIYFIEDQKTFTSIPMCFWWALITITTIGYGDLIPKTASGYVVGSLCAICGVLVIAFTVPIVVGNFVLFYRHVKSRSDNKDSLASGKKLELSEEKMRQLSERNVRNFRMHRFAGSTKLVIDSNKMMTDRFESDSSLVYIV